MKSIPRAIALALTALIAVACGTGSDSPSGGFGRALEHLPDTPDVRGGVWVADIALQRELFQVALPPENVSDDVVWFYASSIRYHPEEDIFRGTQINSSIDGFGDYAIKAEDWRKSVGFTAVNVDLSIVAGTYPATYEVLKGRFDTDAIYRTVRLDDDWKDQLEEKTREGVDYYSWGNDDDVGDLKLRSGIRPLGRGKRLRATEDTVFWTHTNQEMHGLIDVSTGSDGSLASNDDFDLLATIMDDEGVYAGYLTEMTPKLADRVEIYLVGLTFGITQQQKDELASRLSLQALDPYDAYGVGAGYNGTDYYLVISLIYDDEQGAQDNIAAVENLIEEGLALFDGHRWSERFRTYEVRTEGRVLIVTAITDVPELWSVMVAQKDLIFFHR